VSIHFALVTSSLVLVSSRDLPVLFPCFWFHTHWRHKYCKSQFCTWIHQLIKVLHLFRSKENVSRRLAKKRRKNIRINLDVTVKRSREAHITCILDFSAPILWWIWLTCPVTFAGCTNSEDHWFTGVEFHVKIKPHWKLCILSASYWTRLVTY